ncbi:MAG: family 10 glycosylhydrolase [Clostridia bacterium]
MKRIIFLMLIIIFAFCGCSGSVLESINDTTLELYDSVAIDATTTSSSKSETILSADETFSASWLSYLEMFPSECVDDERRYKLYIAQIMDNLVLSGIDNLFVQVRPFADSIYPSEYFPSSYLITGTQGDELAFDYLQAIIDVADEKEISIHAWINPYRVLVGSSDTSELSSDNIAVQWIEEESDNVMVLDTGIYFNPASTEVQELVLNGVRELLENYDLAGIHLDDYFYPSTDESIDSTSFEAYEKSGGTLSLSDFRRENINSLMSALYITTKSYNEDILVSVSPSGDIEKNYSEHYCDVSLWLSSEGYTDMVIPQIYFGFDNETFPYASCLNEWTSLNTEPDVLLVIGLALYKVGSTDEYAGENGIDEWVENDDIIANQVSLALENGCAGFALYKAVNIDFENEDIKKELNNLQSLFE